MVQNYQKDRKKGLGNRIFLSHVTAGMLAGLLLMGALAACGPQSPAATPTPLPTPPPPTPKPGNPIGKAPVQLLGDAALSPTASTTV